MANINIIRAFHERTNFLVTLHAKGAVSWIARNVVEILRDFLGECHFIHSYELTERNLDQANISSDTVSRIGNDAS